MEVIHESSQEPSAPMEIEDDSFQRNPEDPFSTPGSSSESPMVVTGGTVIAKRTSRSDELPQTYIASFESTTSPPSSGQGGLLDAITQTTPAGSMLPSNSAMLHPIIMVLQAMLQLLLDSRRKSLPILDPPKQQVKQYG